MHSAIRFFLLAAVLVASPTDVIAATITIDDGSGAVYDGVLDGFPGIAAFDGIPDLGGNALGVAFKVGTTEERAIIEFPLATVVAVASQVSEANLTFNIDDVLSTFGPGTDFAGRACRRLFVHTYSGNGHAEVMDYSNIQGEGQLVDTTVSGTITDTTLHNSGPLVFHVDVTASINVLLMGGASHLGIVVRCADSPTGTSLDDLGEASMGPPGVNGSRLPYLTVDAEVGPAATPTATSSPTPSTQPPTTTPTATATFTLPAATATTTAVPTYTEATATPTATPTATRTPTPRRCLGDCDGDSELSATELLSLIDNVLLDVPWTCAGTTGDGRVAIDALVNAVADAGVACNAAHPPTP